MWDPDELTGNDDDAGLNRNPGADKRETTPNQRRKTGSRGSADEESTRLLRDKPATQAAAA